MTEQELYRCESHERRVSSLEERVHIQDTATALLSSEVKGLSKNVERLTNMMETVQSTLQEVIPQVKVSKQWEDMYRAGLMFLVGIVVSGIAGVVISHLNK
jgi:uncharacterized coiled-coil protein SlyX